MADSAGRDGRPVWYVRDGLLDSGRWAVSAYAGPEHADGEVLAAGFSPGDGRPVVWRTGPPAHEKGLLHVGYPVEAAPGAPPMWFVQLDEPRSRPPAAVLVAFATETFPPGTVVDRYAFATAGVHNDLQLGAVRWYRTMALVHQIFVSPGHRRRSVGTALLHAADAVHQANGWPGRLHSDGRRTELGEQFIAGLRYPQRFAPLAETMPPMDPVRDS